MKHLAPALALCLSLVPAAASAQARCDCAANTCLPATRGAAVVRGRLTRGEGRDAQNRVERYVALTPERPVCAEMPDMERTEVRRAVRATSLQLVLVGEALRARLEGAVGTEVTLRGSLLEQMTAHHHTPLLLEVDRVETPASPAAADDTEGDESRVSIDGAWRIVDVLLSSPSAVTPRAARRHVGQRASFVGTLRTPWEGCAAPTLSHRAQTADAFATESRLPALAPERAAALGLAAGELVAWTAACANGPTITFHETPAGRILLGRDGAWYVFARAPRTPATR